jgi:hypothetical protein
MENKKESMSLYSRKTWLIFVISAIIALFAMCMYYVHICPKKEVALSFHPDTANIASQGTEFRVNYIMVDDVFIPLKEYASPQNNPDIGWAYDGSLYTYNTSVSAVLSINVKANRVIEVSLKKGPNMTRGRVVVGSKNNYYDFFYADKNNSLQQLVRLPIHKFVNRQTFPIGLALFICVFLILYTLSGKILNKSKTERNSWCQGNITLNEVFICAVILVISILFSLGRWFNFSYKSIFFFDVAVYIAYAKQLLGGFVPYVDFYADRGPVLHLLIALGLKIWDPYGLIILVILLTLIGTIFLYLALRIKFDRFISLLSVIFALMTIKTCNDGLNTEQLTWPFSSIALYVFNRIIIDKEKLKTAWLIMVGVLFSFVVLIRVNNAYLWITAVPFSIFYIIKTNKPFEGLKSLLYMAVGVFFVFTPIFTWLGVNGAIYEWYYDTIAYISAYKQSVGFLQSLGGIFGNYFGVNLKFLLVILLLSVCGIYIKEHSYKKYGLFYLATLFIGVYCIQVSRMNWPHYKVILLPVLALMCAYAAESVRALFEVIQKKLRQTNLAVLLVFAAIIISIIWSPPLFSGLSNSGVHCVDDSFVLGEIKVANYIMSNLDLGEKFAVNGSMHGSSGVLVQNLLRDRYADKYMGIPHDWEKQHRKHYEKILKQKHKFFIDMDGSLCELPNGYKLVLDTDRVKLYEYAEEMP